MSNLSLRIVKILTKKKLTLSFAESCTGGLLASTITSISGSSKIFDMGFVTYSNNSKIKLLKVPKRTITKYGAVSYETCLSMVVPKDNFPTNISQGWLFIPEVVINIIQMPLVREKNTILN